MRSEPALALVGAAAVVALLGFTGVSADNTQYLLAAFKRLDPSFLPNDWFVQGTTSYHPLFELFVTQFLRIEQLQLGLFVWYAVDVVLLCAALLCVMRAVGGRRPGWLELLCCLALVLAGNNQGWGHYQILTPQALPAYMAYPFALFALAMVLERRLVACAVGLALVFVVHRGMGALMVPLLALPFLASMPLRRADLVPVLASGAVLGALILPTVLETQSLDAGHKDALKILFYGRAPHHYAIQFSALRIHLASVHLVLTGILCAFLVESPALRLRYLAFVLAACAAFAAGYVFLELWYVADLVRLFPFRALPLLAAVGSCILAMVVLDPAAAARGRLRAGLLMASMLAFPRSPATAFVLMAVAAAAPLLPRRGLAGVLPSPWSARAGAAAAALAALALLAMVAASPPRLPGPWPNAEGRALAEAFERFVPRDGVVVVPPEYMGLRLQSARALVVNIKAFPVYGPEMVEWADRMLAVTGVDPRHGAQLLRRGIDPLTAYIVGFRNRAVADLVAAAGRYGAGHILVPVRSRFEHEARALGRAPLWSARGLSLFEAKAFSGSATRS